MFSLSLEHLAEIVDFRSLKSEALKSAIDASSIGIRVTIMIGIGMFEIKE